MPDARLVGEASTAQRGLDLAATLRPDVIVSAATLDREPVEPMLVSLRRTSCPATKIVVLASHLDPRRFAAVEDTSIDAYLLWSELCCETLRHCLRAVIVGDVVVASRTVAQAFIAAQRGGSLQREAAPSLTPRERAVLERLAEGLPREAIAAAEGISPRTVERVIGELQAKFDADTSFALGVKAARLGLLP